LLRATSAAGIACSSEEGTSVIGGAPRFAPPQACSASRAPAALDALPPKLGKPVQSPAPGCCLLNLDNIRRREWHRQRGRWPAHARARL
jgi:hypothetical protein